MSRGDDGRATAAVADSQTAVGTRAAVPPAASAWSEPGPVAEVRVEVAMRLATPIDRAALRGLPYDALPRAVQHHFRSMSRQQLLHDPDYHFWLGSRQPHDARVRAGQQGFAAVREVYGEWAYTLAARWRAQHPERASQAERKTYDLLAELGQGHPIHDRDHLTYLREHQVAGYHVDIFFPGTHQVIEVFGGAHFGPFFDPDGHRSASDDLRLGRLRQANYAVLVLTEPDLTRSTRERTKQEVAHFLDKGAWGVVYRIGTEEWE